MIGVPGIDSSRLFISLILPRSLSISGASRRRMPTLTRMRGSAA
jgi:hypothetical protein